MVVLMTTKQKGVFYFVEGFACTLSLSPFPDISNMTWYNLSGSLHSVSLQNFMARATPWHFGHLVLFHPNFFCQLVLKSKARTLTALMDYSISRERLIPYAHIATDNFPIKLAQKLPNCLWSMAISEAFPYFPCLSDSHIRKLSFFMHRMALTQKVYQ